MKTHIMRWAPQDWRTSKVRSRGARRGDQGLRLVYLELLFALHEAGGSLPDDREELEDELALPWRTIEPALKTLALMGKISRDDGKIVNARVSSELAEERAFRQDQAERGRRGARAKAKALREAFATHKDGVGSATAQHSPESGSTRHRPTPPPAPPPTPSPATTPENVLPADAGRDGERPPVPATAAVAREVALATLGPPWNSRACEELNRRYGGTAPGARITKALRPLVGKHGEESVLAAWAVYLDETAAEYVSPERFAATFGRWSRNGAQPARAAPLGKKTQAIAESSKAFLARHGGGSAGSRSVQSGDESAGDPAGPRRGSE